MAGVLSNVGWSFQPLVAVFKGSGKELSIRHCFGWFLRTYCVGSSIPILSRKELMIREKNLLKAILYRLQTFTTHRVPNAGRFLKKKM